MLGEDRYEADSRRGVGRGLNFNPSAGRVGPEGDLSGSGGFVDADYRVGSGVGLDAQHDRLSEIECIDVSRCEGVHGIEAVVVAVPAPVEMEIGIAVVAVAYEGMASAVVGVVAGVDDGATFIEFLF